MLLLFSIKDEDSLRFARLDRLWLVMDYACGVRSYLLRFSWIIILIIIVKEEEGSSGIHWFALTTLE